MGSSGINGKYMGRVVPGETSTTMKVLAILFLATLAYAAPEAEPKADADAAADAWYAYYGHPYRYYGYGGYYGGWRGYYGGYYGYPGYYGSRGWGKRDPEAHAGTQADAETDPAVLYSYAYGHAAVHPYGYAYGYASPYYTYAHHYAPAVYTAPAVTYAAPYRHYANSAGVVHAVAKREADEEQGPNPEANPDADAWGYYSRYYGSPGYYGWGRGYYGYPGYYYGK